MSIRNFFRKFSFNARWRYIRHIKYLREHIELTEKSDKENFKVIHENFERTNHKIGVYVKIRTAVVVLIYISLFSSILGGLIPFLQRFAEPIVIISSAIGATVLTAIFLGLNRVISILMADLIIEHTHLLSILVKNNKEFVAQPDYQLLLFKNYE